MYEFRVHKMYEFYDAFSSDSLRSRDMSREIRAYSRRLPSVACDCHA